MADFQGEQQTTEAHVSHAPKGHEQSDVAIRPLIIIAIILVLGTVFALVILWVAMRTFERTERRDDPLPSPVADARPVPPAPRLQPTIQFHNTLPHEDVLAMHEANQRALGNYEWIDRERGIVRIPIERAMQQLVEQSQQTRQQPATQGVSQ